MFLLYPAHYSFLFQIAPCCRDWGGGGADHHNYCSADDLLTGSIWGGMWTEAKIAFDFFHRRGGWNPWTKVYNNNTWSPLLSLIDLGGPALSRCGRRLFFRSFALPPPSTSASANLPTCYWWSRPRCWWRESSSSSPSSPSASRAWPTCPKVKAAVQDRAESAIMGAIWFGLGSIWCFVCSDIWEYNQHILAQFCIIHVVWVLQWLCLITALPRL